MITEAIRITTLNGNICENVPQLAASLILTAFPTFPTVIYVGYLQEIIYPADRILSSFMLALLCVEVIFISITLQGFIRVKTVQFYRGYDEHAE
mmetsp:Transcript_25499/g.30026  ORF Transcript_25499/g.30026 Transcript_25499/m.30026 type:complete len:94 (-) Transcript_25499:834-1115(-)